MQLLPPEDETSVRRILTEISIPVANDVVAIYSLTGGMADGEMDENCFTLWPLARIVEESRTSQSANLEFGDFLIDSHRYAFKSVDRETSSVQEHHYSEPSDVYEVCESATAFFERYAEASDEHAAFRALHGS